MFLTRRVFWWFRSRIVLLGLLACIVCWSAGLKAQGADPEPPAATENDATPADPQEPSKSDKLLGKTLDLVKKKISEKTPVDVDDVKARFSSNSPEKPVPEPELASDGPWLHSIASSASKIFRFSLTNGWFWLAILAANLAVTLVNNRGNRMLGSALAVWLAAHGVLLMANYSYLPDSVPLAFGAVVLVLAVSLFIGFRWTIPYRWRYYVRWWKSVYHDELEHFFITNKLRSEEGTLVQSVPKEHQKKWQEYWQVRHKRRGVLHDVPVWQQRKLMLVMSVLFWWCSILNVLWTEVLYDALVDIIRRYSHGLDEETKKVRQEVDDLTKK